MVFDSYDFIFIFFPICYLFFFIFNYKIKFYLLSKISIIFFSLVFFSYWNIKFLYLILISIIFNYICCKLITKIKTYKKIIFIFGVLANIIYLGAFKYIDFFILSTNYLFNLNYPIFNIIFPLAISFYTIQQITFLVDVYEKKIRETNLLDYFLFVSFFPQLIAGPIVHYHETIPQFNSKNHKKINFENINLGLIIFSIGLFKKVVIANNLGLYVDAAYLDTGALGFIEAWAASFAFTFQLYFDFSGYTDMAIGLGLFFNIKLPTNFNSPYKSSNLIDFWRSWHITLTRFVNIYIYTALIKKFKIYDFNLVMIVTIITFVILGFWHGPSITFLLFGFVHGVGIVVNHYYRKLNINLSKFISFMITINFVNLSFILFRAEKIDDFYNFVFAMTAQKEFILHPIFNFFENYFFYEKIIYNDNWFKIGNDIGGELKFIFLILLSTIVIFFSKNTSELLNEIKFKLSTIIYFISIFLIGVIFVNSSQTFIYFNF